MKTHTQVIDGITIRRVRRVVSDGTVGLWADGPNSYFNNPRVMRTVDPTDEETELGMVSNFQEHGVAWCTPLKRADRRYNRTRRRKR